ncbi:hypothetical protein LIER_39562 [Lithospermum erythrorhizon]|uniref:Uncharacterized protein n=1 Tax=Lithospermum erythrorhizon TaxID=34254 RepID=A0AAV3QJT1_LITER
MFQYCKSSTSLDSTMGGQAPFTNVVGEVVVDLYRPGAGRIGKGRVLGANTSSHAEHLMVEEPAAAPPPAPTADVMEELRRRRRLETKP